MQQELDCDSALGSVRFSLFRSLALSRSAFHLVCVRARANQRGLQSQAHETRLALGALKRRHVREGASPIAAVQ
eukprot:6200946-Pleurochrysis_carterae.AAC.4